MDEEEFNHPHIKILSQLYFNVTESGKMQYLKSLVQDTRNIDIFVVFFAKGKNRSSIRALAVLSAVSLTCVL